MTTFPAYLVSGPDRTVASVETWLLDNCCQLDDRVKDRTVASVEMWLLDSCFELDNGVKDRTVATFAWPPPHKRRLADALAACWERERFSAVALASVRNGCHQQVVCKRSCLLFSLLLQCIPHPPPPTSTPLILLCCKVSHTCHSASTSSYLLDVFHTHV